MKFRGLLAALALVTLAACSQDDPEPSDGGAAADGGADTDGFTGDENVDCPELHRPPNWPPQPYADCDGLDEAACEAAWNCSPISGLDFASEPDRIHYAGCLTMGAYCFSGGCPDGTGCIKHETDATQPCVFLSTAFCVPPGWRAANCSSPVECPQ